MNPGRTGNGTRFAARPLTVGGTPTERWQRALMGAPELDTSQCRDIVVVAAHPDDETFGFGATASALARSGVRVQVVIVSDGGASHTGLTPTQRGRLVDTRRRELDDATKELGLPAPIWLGEPDGELQACEMRIADALGEILAAGPGRPWCAANWRGDGHPDHEAVGRAAATAAAAAGTTLLEYPVWMWHWAAVDDAAVPWDRLRLMPTDDAAMERKAVAAQCYRSQQQDAAPVLPPFVVARLLTVPEVVFA